MNWFGFLLSAFLFLVVVSPFFNFFVLKYQPSWQGNVVSVFVVRFGQRVMDAVGFEINSKPSVSLLPSWSNVTVSGGA